MNPYNFALLCFSFCSFFVGLLILLKRQDLIARKYFILSIAVTIWSAFCAITYSYNVSYSTALFAIRISEAAAVFIPVTWVHFTLVYLNTSSNFKKLLWILYSIAIVIDCFAFTPLFITELKPAMNFPYYQRPGLLFHVYTLTFIVFVPFGFIQLFKKIRQSNSEEKTQAKGLFVATLCGFVGGFMTFLPIYEIMIPQYGIFLMPIYPFAMAYFMMRHRLFDLSTIADIFQREKLATIGLLAASVNHEIRNPLYVAKTTLESYIERQENGEKSKESLDISKKSLSAVNRALEVITKLNRFAKPSAETRNKGQGARINEAVQNVLDLVSYEFELDKIKIINGIPSDLPSIQADQRQLEEILFNLIVNACHAMSTRKGDRQEILPVPFSQDGTLTLRSTTYDSRLTLEISDTGSGISQDQMKHLFEPFHTTKGEKGTGLGLYITKQLVERNGGKIRVKSEAGKGTSFELEFTRAAADQDFNRKKKLEQELKRVVDTLRREYDPQKILLFGSLAKGHIHPWSDIDLVIVKKTQKRFIERLKEVALLTQPKVGIDFFVYTPQEFQVMISEPSTFQRREMFEKAKVLYDRG